MTCGAIPNPEKPSLGNAAAGEMGAELCERKKQETTCGAIPNTEKPFLRNAAAGEMGSEL
jgi:hypothetical protein